MHLKIFSIIRRQDVITLSPAYDLLNTTIVLSRPGKELALPLNGKRNRLLKGMIWSIISAGSDWN